jgi:hypothetical protein
MSDHLPDPVLDGPAPAAEAQAVGRVAEALRTRFPQVPAEAIAAKVRSAHDEFAGAPIREFVPVLVERRVRAELAAG